MSINTVTATIDHVEACLRGQISSPELFNDATLILGAPGVGKSSTIKKIGKDLNYKVYDLRLARMDSTDLGGLPYFDSESGRTIYYLPEFLPTEEDIKDYDGGIIFLDEITQAEPRLQSTALELVLDRTVGSYKVPDNVWVVAAGNRVEDGTNSYELSSALLDRFTIYNVTSSAQSWLKWAEVNNIHTAVKTFIKTKPDHLNGGYSDKLDTDDMILPTERSWEKVSRIMNSITDNAILKTMIPGVIGASSAQEFFFVTEELSQLAPMETYIEKALAKDIKGLKEILPNTMPGLYGLGYSLPSFCETEEDFVGACGVFNVLGTIDDKLPRSEIVASSMVTLFDIAIQSGEANLARKIRRSEAYQQMRKNQYATFAEIESYKKDQ